MYRHQITVMLYFYNFIIAVKIRSSDQSKKVLTKLEAEHIQSTFGDIKQPFLGERTYPESSST